MPQNVKNINILQGVRSVINDSIKRVTTVNGKLQVLTAADPTQPAHGSSVEIAESREQRMTPPTVQQKS